MIKPLLTARGPSPYDMKELDPWKRCGLGPRMIISLVMTA